MTATVTFTMPETFVELSNSHDAFSASVLISLFHSLAGTWTHELRIQNATAGDLITLGHGFCKFNAREATQIKGEDDSGGNVKEMLVHENGEYTIAGSGQAPIYMPPLLWNRDFVWRIDLRGSSQVVARPQIEKRCESSDGRKAFIFRRKSTQKSDTEIPDEETSRRRMSSQSGKANIANDRQEESIWRRMSVPILHRKSRAEAFEKPEPLQEDEGEDVLVPDQIEHPVSPMLEHRHIPQIDIYATKQDTRKMSFHLHNFIFDLKPDVWRQQQSESANFTVEARGDHFSGEERYGTNYEFLMSTQAAKANTSGLYYVLQWKTVEVVRGPAGKDKTTTTWYTRREQQ